MFPTCAISVSHMSQLPTDPNTDQLEDAADALADARERLGEAQQKSLLSITSWVFMNWLPSICQPNHLI